MPSLTVRLRDDADEAAIKALRVATFETTASKAIMKAVREYPELRRVLKASEARAERLAAMLTEVLQTRAGVSDAQERYQRACRDAGDALKMPSSATRWNGDRARR